MPPPSVIGRAVGLVLVVLGVTVCAISVRGVALAAGHTGTQGTYTVEKCKERYTVGGSGRHGSRTISCAGTFRADRGVDGARTVNPFGAFHPDTVYPAGARVPVQSGDDGTYVATGRKQVWGRAAGVSVSLPMLAAGAFCLLTGFGARRGRPFGDGWDGLPGGTVLRPLLLSVTGVGILGTAVFLFLQHYG
ncbi:hypothetical protein AB0B79_26995 [Streptomyces sp. NPDC039022]|uniref:hypothetical protein n=1 Tax=unclassified Streptomyces TaxID=2593676 RepID=UPI0033DA2E48